MSFIETLVSLIIVAQPQNLSDVTLSLELDFLHRTGASGNYYFPEITGAGAAMLDIDGNGSLDLYLVQSGQTGGDIVGAPDQVFINSLPSSVSIKPIQASANSSYGMGVAVGDVNNDGLPDLLLTNFGENRLMLNSGGANFSDITSESGLTGALWSTSATFLDFDRDGWLDIFVANYVGFPVARNPQCFSASGRRDYCGPSAFPAQHDQVFRNLGNGRFQEVTIQMLGEHQAEPGLGVVAGDFNADGWPDLFVANDGSHNQLWINKQGEGFSNEALFSGVAVNGRGVAEASMGVAVADFDEDGDEDLFLTHLMGETNTFYRNMGNLEFEDATQVSGLAAASRGYTAWATAPVDINQDGWLDLVVFNGAVSILEEQHSAGHRYPYGQPNQVFLNHNGKTFEEVAQSELPASFRASLSSRGAAFGDFDANGSVDILLNNGNAQAQMFAGKQPEANWLGVDLRLANGRPAIGAWIQLKLDDGSVRHRRIRRGGSYASASDPRAVFHLREHTVEDLNVLWPDGNRTQYVPEVVNQYLKIGHKQ